MALRLWKETFNPRDNKSPAEQLCPYPACREAEVRYIEFLSYFCVRDEMPPLFNVVMTPYLGESVTGSGFQKRLKSTLKFFGEHTVFCLTGPAAGVVCEMGVYHHWNHYADIVALRPLRERLPDTESLSSQYSGQLLRQMITDLGLPFDRDACERNMLEFQLVIDNACQRWQPEKSAPIAVSDRRIGGS